MRMTMASQNEKACKIRSKTQRTDYKDEHGIADLRRIDETCNSFKDDGEAKGDEEYGVEKCAQNLRS